MVIFKEEECNTKMENSLQNPDLTILNEQYETRKLIKRICIVLAATFSAKYFSKSVNAKSQSMG